MFRDGITLLHTDLASRTKNSPFSPQSMYPSWSLHRDRTTKQWSMPPWHQTGKIARFAEKSLWSIQWAFRISKQSEQCHVVHETPHPLDLRSQLATLIKLRTSIKSSRTASSPTYIRCDARLDNCRLSERPVCNQERSFRASRRSR